MNYPGRNIDLVVGDANRTPRRIDEWYRDVEARLGRLVAAGKVMPDYYRLAGTAKRYVINGEAYTRDQTTALLKRLEATCRHSSI